jgi:hypothetical protein
MLVDEPDEVVAEIMGDPENAKAILSAANIMFDDEEISIYFLEIPKLFKLYTVCAISYNLLTFFIRSQAFVFRFCSSWRNIKADEYYHHVSRFQLNLLTHCFTGLGQTLNIYYWLELFCHNVSSSSKTVG